MFSFKEKIMFVLMQSLLPCFGCVRNELFNVQLDFSANVTIATSPLTLPINFVTSIKN